MLIEAARRAEAAAKEMLACINAGSAPCAEVREALAVSKAFMAAGSAFQVGAAQVIAKAQRHGDGGTQVLADTVGLTRHDARSQVRTAQAIEAAPAVRDAVETGRVSLANAKRLADAIEKTSPEAVESDAELLASAKSMRPEQFVREARRWTADRQADGGASDYKRLRAKRYVRIWDGDDGTVELHGRFDPVAGRRIGNRLEAEARHLYDADKHADTANSSDTERRSLDHCMADALDNLTATAGAGDGKAFADICVVAHVDDDTGELIAELPDGVRLPQEILEQLSCNAKICGTVYDRTGKPIWRTVARRTVTESQWQLLIARYGGCFHCGAKPSHMPRPPHRTRLTRRTHQARQPRPSLLELPPPDPPRRPADPQQPRRTPHPAPTRPHPIRTGAHTRAPTTVQTKRPPHPPNADRAQPLRTSHQRHHPRRQPSRACRSRNRKSHATKHPQRTRQTQPRQRQRHRPQPSTARVMSFAETEGRAPPHGLNSGSRIIELHPAGPATSLEPNLGKDLGAASGRRSIRIFRIRRFAMNGHV